MTKRYKVNIESENFSHCLWSDSTKTEAVQDCRNIAKNGTANFPKQELKKDNAVIAVYDTAIGETIFICKVK